MVMEYAPGQNKKSKDEIRLNHLAGNLSIISNQELSELKILMYRVNTLDEKERNDIWEKIDKVEKQKISDRFSDRFKK
jgi:hypothetical protein